MNRISFKSTLIATTNHQSLDGNARNKWLTDTRSRIRISSPVVAAKAVSQSTGAKSERRGPEK
jgi:hypothetical protein